MGILLALLAVTLCRYSSSRVTHKEGTLSGIAKLVIEFRGGAGAGGFPNLTTLLGGNRWLHLVFGHSIDSSANTLDVNLVPEIVGDGLAPLLELLGCEFKHVVLVTKDSIGAAGGVREAGTGAEVLAKVVVEAVVGGGDEDNARTVFTKDGGCELLEGWLVEVLDSVGRQDKVKMRTSK